MSKYTYKGPMSGVTLKGGADVILRDGREYELPDDNSWVKSLVAQKRLVPVAGTTTKAGRGSAKTPAPRSGNKSTPAPKPDVKSDDIGTAERESK